MGRVRDPGDGLAGQAAIGQQPDDAAIAPAVAASSRGLLLGGDTAAPSERGRHRGARSVIGPCRQSIMAPATRRAARVVAICALAAVPRHDSRRRPPRRDR